VVVGIGGGSPAALGWADPDWKDVEAMVVIETASIVVPCP
jgi:hypothetical protein